MQGASCRPTQLRVHCAVVGARVRLLCRPSRGGVRVKEGMRIEARHKEKHIHARVLRGQVLGQIQIHLKSTLFLQGGDGGGGMITGKRFVDVAIVAELALGPIHRHLRPSPNLAIP
jgi:hypothetical protein